MACKVGAVEFGVNRPLVLISGPCSIESEALTVHTAQVLKNICQKINMPLIFKASFDKANRTSIESFRGPGLVEGLEILKRIKMDLGVNVTSDIHLPEQAEPAAKVLDLLQIPAFLCKQTDLLIAAGKTQKPVNIKKGQFMAPTELRYAVQKVHTTNNLNVLLTERGNSFGYQDIVVDFRSFSSLRQTGCPIVFDATHSAQKSEHVAALARAAIAVGVDALFLEIHPNPSEALSDGKCSLAFKEAEALVRQLQLLHTHINSCT
jgi:2-dehydro-3-deoxyphosphooctonate aldolase (KDO 8-P synthase)